MKAERLSDKNQALLVGVAKSLLAGVGELPSVVERFEFAIHYRRGLTDAEIGTLAPEWCAIVPRDGAGEGFVLERNT